MKLICLAAVLQFLCGCESLSANERYRSYVGARLVKKDYISQQGNIFTDEEQQTKHAKAAAYITGCTIRRVGMDKTADIIDLLSEAADANVIMPVDRMRTFNGDGFTVKFSGSISRDLNSASFYILVEF